MRSQRDRVPFGTLLIGACLLWGCAPATAPGDVSLVIRSATVIDGRSGTRTEDATIIIDGDRIASIGKSVPASLPPDVLVIDAQGKWVVPGFVDVHVHEAGEPYLRGMLAWGVTSIQLMPNVPPSSPVGMQQASEKGGNRYPRLQVTRMFTGEFPDNLLPGVFQFLKPRNESEAREAVRKLHEDGFRQIKIIQDDSRLWAGMNSLSPRLEKAVFDALVEEAHARGMRVYVHTTQLVDTTMALEAGLEAFMHGTMDAPLEAEAWRRMAAAGTAWTPAYHGLAWYGDRRSYAQRVLADPRLTRLLPDGERQPWEAQAQSEEPIVFEALRTMVDRTNDYVNVMAENTRAALAAGVPIAVGSDGGPAGIATHLEMELLQEHGLTPAEALTAATYGGAVAMGRQAELGTVETGKLADLVVLRADPEADIRNCREIDWVIKGGAAYRPGDLLSTPAPGR